MYIRVWILSLALLLPVLIEQGCTGSPSGAGSASSSLNNLSCTTPPGFSGSPKTIEEAIAQINALPKPVTVDCFLQSLKRPLYVNATNSVTSAQPAFNSRSPRIFILADPMVISVVPEGVGSEVVEFSVVNGTTSLKGEIAFPVLANLASTAAYDRIRFGSGTVCQFCHTNESRALDLPETFAFRSNALRPKPTTKVSLDSLRSEWMNCDFVAEPKRCEILRGLFSQGNIQEKDFPASLPTLF